MEITLPEVAKLLGKSEDMVRKYMKVGMPVLEGHVKGSRGYRFDAADVVAWDKKREMQERLGKGTMSKEEAQRRKLAAEAELAELEIAKKKGDVVELDQLTLELSNRFAELRSSLRRIPERCVLRVIGETDETVIKEIILSEVDAILEEIADE